jgi:hypothetical protein
MSKQLPTYIPREGAKMPARGREEAEKKYADVITIRCPECGTRAGKLCDRGGAWVCFGRFQEYDRVKGTKLYPWELWPL